MNHDQEMSRLAKIGVVAVLRAPTSESCLLAVEALVRGGVTGIEVTYSTPGTADVIRIIRERHGQDVLLGAGTVTTRAQAAEAVDAGAAFLVSPGTTPDLAKAMAETGALFMLGALTPSEVMTATGLGANVVKLFPASLGGPSLLKALRGPFPNVPLMPTGGVNVENIGQWVSAGAVAVGAGSELCQPAAMLDGRFEDIQAAAGAFSAAWREARAAG